MNSAIHPPSTHYRRAEAVDGAMRVTPVLCELVEFSNLKPSGHSTMLQLNLFFEE
jgi:hypothetical protein